MDSLAREPNQSSEGNSKRMKRPDKRGPRSYARKIPRSLIPRFIPHGNRPLSHRALRWLLPWTIADYPGFERGSLATLSGLYALETLRAWWKGACPMPAVAALMLADAMDARIKAGRALVLELRAYAL